jgi:indole-3-glycerol phosphate synthase
MMDGPATDLLATIVAATARAVAVRAAARPLARVEQEAAQRRPGGEAFRAALTSGDPPRIIAECKRRSPSRGILRKDYDPAALAASYARGGAAAISVLTEPTFFDGDLEHLRAVRRQVELPLLRKDFVVSSYQIAESREAGADAVLLIAGALSQEMLTDLLAEAEGHGLAALVEVHDDAELGRAMRVGATIVGVNSRSLRTLEVDLDVTRALIDRVPDGVIAVAESGLKCHDDLADLQARGYDAFLVGERFMTDPDPGAALRAMRRAGDCRDTAAPGAGGSR